MLIKWERVSALFWGGFTWTGNRKMSLLAANFAQWFHSWVSDLWVRLQPQSNQTVFQIGSLVSFSSEMWPVKSQKLVVFQSPLCILSKAPSTIEENQLPAVCQQSMNCWCDWYPLNEPLLNLLKRRRYVSRQKFLNSSGWTASFELKTFMASQSLHNSSLK